MKPIIAITAGDTNGVGYEVIIKALLNGYVFEIMRPVIYGNAAVAKQHIQTLIYEIHNRNAYHLLRISLILHLEFLHTIFCSLHVVLLDKNTS